VRTVVEMREVSQLVADDIVHQWFVEQEQPHVEIHIAQRGTRAPSRTHVLERQSVETHSSAFGPRLHARCEHKAALAAQLFHHAAIEPLLSLAQAVVQPRRQAQTHRTGRTAQLCLGQTGHFLNVELQQSGGKGKIPVEGTSLAMPEINQAGQKVLEILRTRKTPSRDLKTLLIRASQRGEISAQLYVKDENFTIFSEQELSKLNFKNFEIIFSNPKSPASVITERLQNSTDQKLQDSVLGIDFNYATESFFQINLPVYEQALRDMQKFIDTSKPTVDLYSGVGSIGLTIGAGDLTLVEINEFAVDEMQKNIKKLNREETAKAILAPSEKALEFIKKGSNLIVDPPRAGMNREVCEKILEIEPEKVIYLSCNPATQARDVAILSKKYEIICSRGYNFFPRTPHIENLIVMKIRK